MTSPRPAPYPADTRAKGWRYSVGAFLDAARVAPEKAVFRPALPMFLLPGWNGTNMGKMAYGEQLKHPNWQRKRLEVLQRSDFKCERCGNGESTIHVHHKQYFKGRMAWEYDSKELAALCEDCHQEEHDEVAKRSSIMARLDMDGPLSTEDFIAHGAGATSRFHWMLDAQLSALLAEVEAAKPFQFQAGRAGVLLSDLVTSKSSMLHLADLLAVDDDFRDELLALLKKYRVKDLMEFAPHA